MTTLNYAKIIEINFENSFYYYGISFVFILFYHWDKLRFDSKNLKLRYMLISLIPVTITFLGMKFLAQDVYLIDKLTWKTILVITVFGPFVEEYIYRYSIINLCNGKYRYILAIVSIISFVVGHESISINLVFDSFMFTIIFLRSDNLIYSIMMHIMANSIVIFSLMNII